MTVIYSRRLYKEPDMEKPEPVVKVQVDSVRGWAKRQDDRHAAFAYSVYLLTLRVRPNVEKKKKRRSFQRAEAAVRMENKQRKKGQAMF